MSDSHTSDTGTRSSGGVEAPVSYPTNQVVGVVARPEDAAAACTALTSSGFLQSEVTVTSGPAAADAIRASTGRTGLANVAIRIAERFGVHDEEMETKASYEQALRDGKLVVGVLAPTDERKELATRILREHGARPINFLGKLTIEPLER
jgi:hypothetical protein